MPDTAASPFRINPALDLDELAMRFARTGRIQIADFLADDGADALRAELLASADWHHVVNGSTQVFEIPRARYDALPVEQREALDAAVIAGAAKGFQYRYDSIRVPDDPNVRAALAGRLAGFARFMSAPETLTVLGRIGACPPLRFADAQATRYRAGDFLTRHDDDVAGKHRALAYVLGLTPEWQPEWGGLLLFADGAGGLADAMAPRFNGLCLFAVPQPHSVGYVAPFAMTDRVSVTGWLRREIPDRP